MIFTDTGDRELDEFKKAPNLRKLTGANAMISELALPPVNEKFVQKHIESGALFYRIVTTQDLINYKVEELLLVLNKMLESGLKNWQSILLLDSSHTLLDFEDCISKIDAWSEHGGSTLYTLGYPATYYLTHREKSFLATTESRKTVLVPIFGPRKEIEVNKDWTVTLATFPYVGYQGAQAIRKLITSEKQGDDLLTAMMFLTDEEKLKGSDGQWLKVRKAAREWLGLPDGFNLDIQFTGTVTVKELED